jgi:hypothetical protein
MASYLPPTESLPIFDNTVFDSNNTTALTYATAKNLFVTFPSAQGSSTITDFIAGTINYLSPSSGSFFNIGTNQVSGGTIRLGPTGVSGVSVHAGNIDCTNNQINNATDGALNNLTIGNLQTDGILNIGTGVRTTTGAINIGTGSGANVNHINIGGAGSKASFTNGLTLASGKYISTSHTGTVTAPTATQVGGIFNTVTQITSTAPATSGNVSSLASMTLPAGSWIVSASRSMAFSATTNKAILGFGTRSTSNVALSNTLDFTYGASMIPNPTGGTSWGFLTVPINVTVDTPIYLNVWYTGSGSSFSSTDTTFYAMRIA